MITRVTKFNVFFCLPQLSHHFIVLFSNSVTLLSRGREVFEHARIFLYYYFSGSRIFSRYFSVPVKRHTKCIAPMPILLCSLSPCIYKTFFGLGSNNGTCYRKQTKRTFIKIVCLTRKSMFLFKIISLLECMVENLELLVIFV